MYVSNDIFQQLDSIQTPNDCLNFSILELIAFVI